MTRSISLPAAGFAHGNRMQAASVSLAAIACSHASVWHILANMAHDHAHENCGHAHGLAAGRVTQFRLAASVGLTLSFVACEAVAGYWSNSLALLSDAGHNFADAAALVLSWYALRVAERPSTRGMTFGFHRVGILAALINSCSLVLMALLIFWDALARLRSPGEVQGGADDRHGPNGRGAEPGHRPLAAQRPARSERSQRLHPHAGRRGQRLGRGRGGHRRRNHRSVARRSARFAADRRVDLVEFVGHSQGERQRAARRHTARTRHGGRRSQHPRSRPACSTPTICTSG